MWLATGRIGADLSKTISKKSLEIVLDTEILAPSTVLDFWKDKTPKSLDFSRDFCFLRGGFLQFDFVDGKRVFFDTE